MQLCFRKWASHPVNPCLSICLRLYLSVSPIAIHAFFICQCLSTTGRLCAWFCLHPLPINLDSSRYGCPVCLGLSLFHSFPGCHHIVSFFCYYFCFFVYCRTNTFLLKDSCLLSLPLFLSLFCLSISLMEHLPAHTFPHSCPLLTHLSIHTCLSACVCFYVCVREWAFIWRGKDSGPCEHTCQTLLQPSSVCLRECVFERSILPREAGRWEGRYFFNNICCNVPPLEMLGVRHCVCVCVCVCVCARVCMCVGVLISQCDDG